MCYRVEIKANIKDIAKHYQASIDATFENTATGEINGFDYPKLPVVIDKAPQLIVGNYQWGLIPFFCKDDSIKENTLNARIETLHEKAAFRNAIGNRCLIYCHIIF